MTILTLFIALVAFSVVSSAISLAHNIKTARSIGIPVLWSPIDAFNPFWIIFNKALTPKLQRLPFGLGEWTKRNSLDWTWIDRAQGDSEIHRKFGETFAHVTPRGIEIHTRDPNVSDQVLRKKSADFPKISHYAKVMDVFGSSLVSSDMPDWNRHRKITVTSLNDKTNGLVWSEAIYQTQQMVDHYMRSSEGRVIDALEDTSRLYLHVFTAVCCGVKYEYMAAADIPEGHSRSFEECLHTSMKDILIQRLVPSWAFRLPVLPKRIADYRDASSELLEYFDEMVSSAEKDLQDNNKSVKINLLTDMVRRSEELRKEQTDGSLANNLHLTGPEIRGNLFTYARGGHESAAHTLTFALYLLAAYPRVQEWLFEELHAVLGNEDNLSSPETFTRAFSKLPRSLAIMNETLRLWPSVTVLPKCTGAESSTISLEGQEKVIPAGINVYVNMPSIQVHPAIWGEDARVWKPSRWIESTKDHSPEEQVKPPPLGAFVAWSEGKRVCPGKRFSQVNFVAALAAMFLRFRAEVIPREGESQGAAEQRTVDVVNDTYAITTVYMRDPQSVKIQLVRRTK
ncbi:hypothetical protein NX059_007678 [Plenodomus lindquistii]|nr:hypothetical protein NX059_007678 [Plenodomus lindquistii]